MTVQQKQDALKNAMEHFNFPKKYFPFPTTYGKRDAKFALASMNKGELGGEVPYTHSRFMTYDEFNAYLVGWYDATMKKF